MTYDIQVRLIIFWLVVSQVGAVLAMLAIGARWAPPLSTQVNQKTGVTTHGVGRWLAAVELFCAGPPLVAYVACTISEGIDRLTGSENTWVVPVVGSLFLLGVVIGVALRRHRQNRRRQERQSWAPPVPYEPELRQPTEPPMGWSLPADADQWDQR